MGDQQGQDAQILYRELTDYERRGVDILLNGWPASPMQIVQAHMVREDVVYMRDYKMNEKGDIEELGFHKIKLEKKEL
ncbi:MAG: hypothetical protein ACI4UH_00875 [Dorea sp.]